MCGKLDNPFKEKKFHFFKIIFLPHGKDILSVPQGGDAGLPYD